MNQGCPSCSSSLYGVQMKRSAVPLYFDIMKVFQYMLMSEKERGV